MSRSPLLEFAPMIRSVKVMDELKQALIEGHAT